MDLGRRPTGNPPYFRKLAAAAPLNSSQTGKKHPVKAILAGRYMDGWINK